MKPLFTIKPARRRRKTRGTLVLALLILIALGYGGYRLADRTETLAPFKGQVESFARAEPIKGLEVCWLETGSMSLVDATASSLLIRHPQGAVLIDAGTSMRFAEEVEPFPTMVRTVMKLGPGSIRAKRPVSAHLEALKTRPEQLLAIIPTHAHVDHLGGVLDVPDTVPIWTTSAERNFARAEVKAAVRSVHVMPTHAKALEARGVELELDRTGGFAKHRDLFGDGSVLLVDLAGHTPGSIGVWVTLPSGRRLFLTGDAINRVSELAPAQSKRAVMRASDVDEKKTHALVSRLSKLREVDPALEWLPAHDRTAWIAAFGSPGKCLGEEAPKKATEKPAEKSSEPSAQQKP